MGIKRELEEELGLIGLGDINGAADVMMLKSLGEHGQDYSLVSRCLETEQRPAMLCTGHPLIPAFTSHNALATGRNFR